ncbi:NAD(+) diphosphatase [uncultured Actinomyces sp.]|uniref:NAD(+) diphosphatase n=1 Tax=uncultured Actinomyces sp. TaxID=249061 RepID=UPI0026719ACB|nr:NAD(+) diphosphatase [uncultured Actinomyces sp.]
MSLDLPLVRGDVDPSVALRETAAPVALVRAGEADVIVVDPAGFVLLDEAGARPSDTPTLRRLAGDEAARAAEGTTASFIGVAGGRSVVAIETSRDEARGCWEHLRAVGWRLGGNDAALALTAVALAGWHASYRYCGRCGSPVSLESAGWAARCQACDRLEYPRQDPAIIVLVQDHDGRVLLAHNALWKPGFVSIIAGYVEAGESPDVTVAREVAEEVGVEIEATTYVATQPWPFGRSQMMGYRARTALPRPTPQADGVEIEWARFYSREDLARALESGEISAPGRASIAYALLREWYGSDLPGAPEGRGRS